MLGSQGCVPAILLHLPVEYSNKEESVESCSQSVQRLDRSATFLITNYSTKTRDGRDGAEEKTRRDKGMKRKGTRDKEGGDEVRRTRGTYQVKPTVDRIYTSDVCVLGDMACFQRLDAYDCPRLEFGVEDFEEKSKRRKWQMKGQVACALVHFALR